MKHLIGILVFLFYMAIGIAAANRIFSDDKIYIRAWAGGIIGILGMMWLVVPFSFIFGFSVLSNILALISMLGMYLLVRYKFKKEGSLTYTSDKTDIYLYVLVIIISGITIYLLNGHVLAPGADGLYAGQSTYGDLSMHLGFITSIANQHTFPPEYSIFPGTLLSYPFLADSLSSTMYLFGTSLRWSVLIPSYAMVILLVSGIFLLTCEIMKNRIAAAVCTVLFFFNGGFGFAYFIDGMAKNPDNFYRMFSAWYNTPTNYNENYLRWSNIICDMIIPQRTALAGWMAVVFAFWLLNRAITRESKRYFLLSGITAGLLPMIHTHSFLAFGIISGVWSIAYYFNPSKNLKASKDLKIKGNKGTEIKESKAVNWIFIFVLIAMLLSPGFFSRNLIKLTLVFVVFFTLYLVFYSIQYKRKEDVINYIKRWIYFVAPVLVLALPQLVFWTFRQASGFTKLQPGWQVNGGDIWPWFWIKNIGLIFIILFPAILAAKKGMLTMFSGALAVFVISNLIQFQPNEYDNNKLLYIWFIYAIIIVVDYIFNVYERLEGTYGRWSVLAIILIICTLSGLLTIGREINSNKSLLMFGNDAIKASEFIKDKTPADSLFISGDEHLNPVAVLAGRNIFSGTSLYLYFHGVNKENRDQLIDRMYKDPASFSSLSQSNKVDYVYYSNEERRKFGVEPDFFIKNYPTVFHQGDIYIFAISERARRLAS